MKQFIDETFDRQVRDLQELVRIPSVSRGEPETGMPLGRHVHDALEKAFSIAHGLGLTDTRSLDGYCGVIDYGEGDETLLIMAHLDVVPAGPGWSLEPFSGEIRDGRLYGRGVLDDKGAAVSAIYALAAVKDAGIPLRRKVRILLGCDEEVGWKCIDRYKQTEPEPDLAFTPDADYPIVHSEMGISHFVYTRALHGSAVRADCGTASNVIPGEAAASLAFPPAPCELPAPYRAVFGENEIRVTGRGGHAAMPELATNALQGLFLALAAQPLEGDDLAIASGLAALFSTDCHGEGFGLDVKDESGFLTLMPDMLHWDENGVSLTLDCRHPFSVTDERLDRALDENFSALGFVRSFGEHKAGHFIPVDSELVSTLLGIYRRHSGSKTEPMSIGGGTYARAFKNAVAFGIEPEGEPSRCHMPDEFDTLAHIRFNTVVMADAIRALAGK